MRQMVMHPEEGACKDADRPLGASLEPSPGRPEMDLDQRRERLRCGSGEADQNREQGLKSPIVLDSGFSVGRAFGASGTPSAVLVDAEGKIASGLAVGGLKFRTGRGTKNPITPRSNSATNDIWMRRRRRRFPSRSASVRMKSSSDMLISYQLFSYQLSVIGYQGSGSVVSSHNERR